MNEEGFKHVVKKLKEIGKALEELPAEIRALAFPYLADYVGHEAPTDGTPVARPRSKTAGDAGQQAPPPADREGFFRSFDHDKPADNAKLLAAWFYREYGTEAFSTEDIKQLADEVGLTVPGRLDMTFASAKENAKALFSRAGRGLFKPTVHGEAYLKETYRIKKGTKQRPARTS